MIPSAAQDPAREADQHDDDDDRADRAGGRHPGGAGAECGGRGQGQQPGEGHLPRDAPVHGGDPATRPGADDRAGGDLRGGQREAEVRRGEDDRSGARSGGEALRRLDLADAHAEGLDDPPPTRIGAERDRETRRDDDPERRTGVGGQHTGGGQRQRDDPHGLLRIVGAVGERDHRRGDDLADLESLGDGALRGARGDPVGEVGRDQRDEPGDDRRQDRGQEHLADQARELDRVGTRGNAGGADEAADQCVRRARG